MTENLAREIAEAYRWQRRLGNPHGPAPFCHIVADPVHPEVWDANHADAVTARTDAEIDAVFAAMDARLGHSLWRVVHTDCFTPDAFLARLAFDDFQEQPVTIQMALRGDITQRDAAIALHPVGDEADWRALLRLVLANHAEGDTARLSTVVSAGLVAGYRAKAGGFHFHFAMRDGVPVAYGAFAVAPNGVGMIENLFTLPSARRQGIASAMIAAFVDRLRAQRCHSIFLGALAADRPKRLYARLGFHPVTLARSWVREVPPRG